MAFSVDRPPPLRVLVVDDSAYNRKNIADILAGSDEIEVVGKAGDGDEALRLASSLKPDCITLDLEMPRMDGFTFLRILMARQPTPVIVVSSYSNKENVFKALELGAIDFVAKPDRQFSPDGPIRKEILSKVLLVRHLRPLGAATPRAATATGRVQVALPAEALPRNTGALRWVIAIASSTGGPSALLELFTRLPDRLPGAILIAQHMPDKFTKTFAERLDKKGGIRVVEAADGELVSGRRAYVCPGKMCMELYAMPGTSNAASLGDLRLRVGPPSPNDRYVPSADRLFRSVAGVAGARGVGVVLTGMGEDGVIGGRAIRAAGGAVIAESEETAVVFGMPGAVIRAGIASEQLPLYSIADWLGQLG